MRPVDSYEMVLEYLKEGPPVDVPQWMCGLLFAPPWQLSGATLPLEIQQTVGQAEAAAELLSGHLIPIW